MAIINQVNGGQEPNNNIQNIPNLANEQIGPAMELFNRLEQRIQAQEERIQILNNKVKKLEEPGAEALFFTCAAGGFMIKSLEEWSSPHSSAVSIFFRGIEGACGFGSVGLVGGLGLKWIKETIIHKFQAN